VLLTLALTFIPFFFTTPFRDAIHAAPTLYWPSTGCLVLSGWTTGSTLTCGTSSVRHGHSKHTSAKSKPKKVLSYARFEWLFAKIGRRFRPL
jgi:hypothetical protein